ncbi:MAG TPA: aminotransferase class V-fold PLP-dependent enzyme, partial [Treponemataceae bacterium]|nr:aminotransferase class V-fold PLP-dependent enzyme [Treponemataceae bacterium]
MSAHLDSGTIRAMEHLASFRKNIIGNDESVPGPYGSHRLVYADWIASGRLYRPIEERMTELVGPWTANTHSESSHLGQAMTIAYREARERLRKEVNASADDVVLPVGSGMTGAVSKLQRMLGLKIPENLSGILSPSIRKLAHR